MDVIPTKVARWFCSLLILLLLLLFLGRGIAEQKKNSSVHDAVQVVPVTGCHCFRRMEILDIAISPVRVLQPGKHSLRRLHGPCLFIVYLYLPAWYKRKTSKLLLLYANPRYIKWLWELCCARLEQHEMLMLSAKANLISPSCIALNLHNLNYLWLN